MRTLSDWEKWEEFSDSVIRRWESLGGVCKERSKAIAKILTILKQAGLFDASRGISIPKIAVGRRGGGDWE